MRNATRLITLCVSFSFNWELLLPFVVAKGKRSELHASGQVD